MATVREDQDGRARVSTSFTYGKVKAIPNLSLPALHRTHSAGAASVASTSPSATHSEKVERHNIPPDEPCFITKRPGYSLEKAHLVNAVRKNERLKFAVEFFLRSINLVSRSFSLNSASNLISLDQTLHYTLDKLAFFAITCSKATLLAMLDVVKAENRMYDERGGFYTRYFQFDKPPFSNAEYEMVVLHPDHFLPAGSTIAMHTKDPNDTSRLVGKLYMIGADGALREGRESTSPRFSAFSISHSRALPHRVHPLLVVLNAHMVLRRFRRLGQDYLDRLCPDYRELVNLTIQLGHEIYHQPLTKGVALDYRAMLVGGGGGTEDEDEDEDEDVDMDAADEFGVGTGANKDKTITPKMRGGRAGGKRVAATFSRFGEEINYPGPDASPEELEDFCCYIISGRDDPLTRRDEAILASIGLHPDDEDDEAGSAESEDEDDEDGAGVQSVVDSQVQGFMEKVSTWQSSSVAV